MANKSMKLELPPLQLAHAELSILGDTPLIVHAWSQKAKEQMLLQQMKLPRTREPKDPVDAFLRSMYRTDQNHYGIPAVGVKNAMVTACTSVEGITKTAARQAFIIVGERGKTKAAFADLFSPQDLVRILSPKPPTLREDMVRLAGIGNTADLRYRAEYWPWAARLTIRYNQNVLSIDQLANLLNTAGFGVGLCEWRPERDGQSGTFHVGDEHETRMIASRDWQKHREPDLPDVSDWIRSLNADNDEEVAEPRRRGRRAKIAIPEGADDPVFVESNEAAANDAPPRRRGKRNGAAHP
jgi:hypothetical protein